MTWDDCDAVLFDLDGVLTPTAEVHMRAWQQMFEDFLTRRGITDRPYTESDYFDYIDGKPRYDGVRAFLASRDIELPRATRSDRPERGDRVRARATARTRSSPPCSRDEGVAAVPRLGRSCSTSWPSAAPRSRSSRPRSNAPEVLGAAGLASRFAVVVDGNVAAERRPARQAGAGHLPRRRGPARRAAIERAVVVEDAVSGVQAGRAGDFGLVIGVDRGVGADRLREPAPTSSSPTWRSWSAHDRRDPAATSRIAYATRWTGCGSRSTNGR